MARGVASTKRRVGAACCAAVVACGVAGRLLLGNGAQRGHAGFLQPTQQPRPLAEALPQPRLASAGPGLQEEAEASSGRLAGSGLFLSTAAICFAAAAAAASTSLTKTAAPECRSVSVVPVVPADSSAAVFVVGAAAPSAPCSAQIGQSGELPVVAMSGIPRRRHVRICDRTKADLRRGIRKNKAAKVRFMIKPDGSIWRRQAGLRHLKSKKTPAHLKRLKRMVRVTRKWHDWLYNLLKYRVPTTKASDLIMRKFNAQRLKKREGLADRGVGHALWT